MAGFPNREVGRIQQLLGAARAELASDGQLVGRLVEACDPVAYETLVHRHGPLVLGVCRRVLDDAHLAEDAFQATFLLLLRRAGSIARPESLGSWLYGVAYRLARRVRDVRNRRRVRERTLVDASDAAREPELAVDDLRPVLDEELGRLPEKYRAPLVLHYLEGKSKDQTAQALGWTPGTVSGRLRARDLLRGRLARRGLMCSVAVLAERLTAQATAVPPALTERVVRSGLLVMSGGAGAAGAVPVAVAALVEGSLRTMWVTRLIAAVAVVLGLSLVGGVGLGWRAAATAQPAANAATEPEAVAPPRPGRPVPEPIDWPQDAKLPLGALACLGRAADPKTAVTAVALAPDGRTLALAIEGEIRLWNLATQKEIRRCKLPPTPASPAKERFAQLAKREKYVGQLSFTADGKGLAATWAGAAVMTVGVWDVATGDFRRQFDDLFTGGAGFVNIRGFSADGRKLTVVVVEIDEEMFDEGRAKVKPPLPPPLLTVLDVASGKIERRSLGQGFHMQTLSPDGKTFACAGVEDVADRRNLGPGLAMRDTATRKQIWAIKDPPALSCIPRALAFAPDGRVLACLTADGKLAFRAAGDGQELAKSQVLTEREIRNAIPALAFSPDGGTLALTLGVNDPERRIWLLDATTGRERRTVRGPAVPQCMTFSSDGALLITGNDDGTAVVWDGAGGFPRPRDAGKPVTKEQLNGYWNDLTSEEGGKAEEALAALRTHLAEAAPFLWERVRTVTTIGPEIRRLLADLDSNEFATRERAAAELEKLGGRAEAALLLALASPAPALDLRHRLEGVLEKLKEASLSTESLQLLRAIEVLERNPSRETRQCLETLKNGAGGQRVARLARLALERMPASAAQP